MALNLIQRLSKGYITTAVLALTTGAFLLASANNGVDVQRRIPSKDYSELVILSGPSDYFEKNCASCHGIVGTGIGPESYDFDKGEYKEPFKGKHRPTGLGCPSLTASSFEYVKDVVTKGKYCSEHGWLMPAFPDITDKQVYKIMKDFRYFGRLHKH